VKKLSGGRLHFSPQIMIHVFTVDGPLMDIAITGVLKYETLTSQISVKLNVPAVIILLFANRKLLDRNTEFNVPAGTYTNVIAVNPDDYPLKSFPRGEWMFPWDIGKFVRISPRSRFPSETLPVKLPTTLRQIIPNVGYECGDPHVLGPTLTLPPRTEFPIETRAIFQEKCGEFEEIHMRQKRFDKARSLREFRETMTAKQDASLRRLFQLGFDLDVVTYVYLQNDCDESAAFSVLAGIHRT
jgi:hypothetical protein